MIRASFVPERARPPMPTDDQVARRFDPTTLERERGDLLPFVAGLVMGAVMAAIVTWAATEPVSPVPLLLPIPPPAAGSW